MNKVSTSTQARPPAQSVVPDALPASRTNPRLRNFIIIGLALAAIFAVGFWLLNQPSQPPQLPIYSGAHITKQEQSNDARTIESQVDNVSLKKLTDFYDQELTKNGWIKLNVGTGTEIEYSVAYESKDEQWGLSIHIIAFPERGYSLVDLYLQRLGQN